MAGPRIIFTRFSNADSPKLVPWRVHRRRVIGSQGERVRSAADGPRLAVVWQLVSANNRELARGADIFDDFQDAVVSATEAVEFTATDGSVFPVSDEVRGSYGWYLNVFDFPAVVCSRWYVAERERRQSLQLTLESLPIATIASGARQYVDRPPTSIRQLA